MRLLVPVDLSAATDKTLSVAQATAERCAASVTLLHVAEPDPAFVGYQAGPQEVRQQVADEYRDQHRQLQALAERFRKAGIDTQALLMQGATADTILREAVRLDAAMIIMATHGHGAMFDMLIGSVSQAVVRSSSVPVLLVPARP